MKVYIFIILIFVFSMQIYSQNTNENFKLIQEKPSVFISYVHKSNSSLKNKNGIRVIYWFRINNNTKGIISFCYYDTSVSQTGKIGVHYEVEKSLNKSDLSTRDNSTTPLGFPTFDFCNEYNLKSGDSFLFGIPTDHLIKGTRFKIRFYFPWEDVFESRTGGEPSHYIYFYEINLPNSK